MKKLLSILLASVMCVGMLASCSSSSEATTDESEDKLVVRFLGAQFGDKSYWDSAKAGMEQAQIDFADVADIEIIETTSDEQKHLSAMYECADMGADVIITAEFVDNLLEVAEQYPDIMFITWDEPITDVDNIYSVGFKTSEGAFFGGMIAADVSASGSVGFIGGMDETPTIQEFLAGYMQGAKYYDDSITISSSYVGSWSDSAKAKELAFVQYANADIVFACAGSSSVGVIEAAYEEGKFVLGVDADQSALYEGKDEQASIVSSVLKRMDNVLYDAIADILDGNFESGYEILGFAEGAVGIVKDDFYEEYVSEEGKAMIEAAEAALSSGEIEVQSILNMSQEEIMAYFDSIA